MGDSCSVIAKPQLGTDRIRRQMLSLSPRTPPPSKFVFPNSATQDGPNFNGAGLYTRRRLDPRRKRPDIEKEAQNTSRSLYNQTRLPARRNFASTSKKSAWVFLSIALFLTNPQRRDRDAAKRTNVTSNYEIGHHSEMKSK